MAEMIALTVFYGGLALIALWASWGRAPWRESFGEPLRWIGALLVLGWLTSNILYHTVPVEERVGPYTFIEVIIALAASWTFKEMRNRGLIALVAVNLLSIGFNFAFALHDPPSDAQLYLWETATNACFAAECLIVTSMGMWHGYRTGRFRRRLRRGGAAAAPHAARDAD